MRILFVYFILFFASMSFAAEKLISTGEVFDKEGKNKKFTYERFQSIDGDKVSDRAVYKDVAGEVLTEEKIVRVNGKLIRYDMDQKQTKKKAWIDVKDGKVTFNLKKPRKNNYPITSKLPDDFIMGLQIVPMIIENWDLLNNGQKKKFKLGVWHRQEAISFRLEKSKGAGSEMVVKMSPTSFIIRAAVNPIYFTFDKKTKYLLSYKGRTTPKEKRGRNFYDFDGLTRYKTLSGPEPRPKGPDKKK